jgi:hypothetical protein
VASTGLFVHRIRRKQRAKGVGGVRMAAAFHQRTAERLETLEMQLAKAVAPLVGPFTHRLAGEKIAAIAGKRGLERRRDVGAAPFDVLSAP